MASLAAIPFLVILPYCLVQTIRDFRRRLWWLAGWGVGTVIINSWAIEVLTRSRGH